MEWKIKYFYWKIGMYRTNSMKQAFLLKSLLFIKYIIKIKNNQFKYIVSNVLRIITV